MILRTTLMSSPAAESGACRPPDAVEAIRKRLRPTGAAMLLDGRMVGETRPWGPIVSICPDTKNAPPEGGAERLRKVIACRQNCPGQRIAYCAHLVARRSFLLKRRQAFQQALLQRAARPNFFPSQGNTLSQTLPAFGARCQPRRCLRSSRRTSVVSSYRSNPTHRVSPSLLRSTRCHPSRSGERFPI